MMNMKIPLISVVVPALNAEETVEDCIKSLLDQKYPKEKYEIIVVDNESTDNTFKIIKKFRRKIKIFNEIKKGSYCARNRGIKNAKGKIIAFTDSDCIVDKYWLIHIGKAFKDKNIKLVGGNVRAIDTGTTILKYCDEFCHTQKLYAGLNMPFFAGANMAVRKNDLMRLNGFNESLKSGGDVELCSRLVNSKKEVSYEEKAIVNHIYRNSIIELMKKHYCYGRWHKFRRQNFNLREDIKIPKYANILADYGAGFLILRILQDISYVFGLHFGWIVDK